MAKVIAFGNDNTPIFEAGLTCRQSAVLTNSTLVSAEIPGLTFPVLAGRRYWFEFDVVYQTPATTTGIAFLCAVPALTSGYWRAEIQQGGTGTDQYFQQSNSGLSTVVSASVNSADTDYFAILKGVLEPSADGTLQLRARSEVDASQITVQDAGVGLLVDCG